MSMNANRRRHARVEASDVAGHLKHEGELQLGLGIENLSLGGLLLRTHQPLTVGAPVRLELVRPGMKALQLVGRVLNVHPLARPGPKRGTHGLSIRFNPMSEDTQARLKALVSSLIEAARPGPPAPPTPARAVPAPAAPGPRVDPTRRHNELDLELDEPRADREPEPVSVPASAKLTAQLQSRDASLEELRALLDEREREVQQLKAEMATKNEHLDKLRRALLEVRHRR